MSNDALKLTAATSVAVRKTSVLPGASAGGSLALALSENRPVRVGLRSTLAAGEGSGPQ